MSATTIFVSLAHESCYSCGVVFGLETSHRQRLLDNHETFYCPNGHGQHYLGKSETERRAEKAEAEAKQARADAEWYRGRSESAQREANLQKHRARGLKAAQTRMKKRVANGVCPCCTRSFENLQRHMATKHPKYGTAASPPETTER